MKKLSIIVMTLIIGFSCCGCTDGGEIERLERENAVLKDKIQSLEAALSVETTQPIPEMSPFEELKKIDEEPSQFERAMWKGVSVYVTEDNVYHEDLECISSENYAKTTKYIAVIDYKLEACDKCCEDD